LCLIETNEPKGTNQMTLATEQEAVREWAANVGYEDHYKDRQWICSNYDTWERNPHYTGPEQRHPEDDEYGDDDEYFNLLVTVEEISRLKQPVTIRFSFCERDMSRNDIPF
jgi:hypothetical protein